MHPCNAGDNYKEGVAGQTKFTTATDHRLYSFVVLGGEKLTCEDCLTTQIREMLQTKRKILINENTNNTVAAGILH